MTDVPVSMIEATGLTRRFGRFTAVDAVDLRLAPGRVVGFLGRNGAGKTTTIRMIAGSLAPTAGTIRVDGIDAVADPVAAHRRIGYLPEAAPLYTEMRVADFLHFRGRLFGLRRAERDAAVALALQRCGIDDVARRPIGTLSKGYRQRVGLAAALLHEPPLLILDEPTSGLDPAQLADIRRLIRDLAGEHTILLSTHIMQEVEAICDDVIMISAGRIIADGPVEQIRRARLPHTMYIVETDDAAAGETLQRVPGVERIDRSVTDDGWHRCEIVAASTAGDRREAIAAALRSGAGGCTVRALQREEPTMEQVFLALEALAADPAPSGARPGPPPGARPGAPPGAARPVDAAAGGAS